VSYARFGCDGSEVYVIPVEDNGNGATCACYCSVPAIELSRLKMLAHLVEHERAGVVVPDCTYAQIVRDAFDGGDLA